MKKFTKRERIDRHGNFGHTFSLVLGLRLWHDSRKIMGVFTPFFWRSAGEGSGPTFQSRSLLKRFLLHSSIPTLILISPKPSKEGFGYLVGIKVDLDLDRFGFAIESTPLASLFDCFLGSCTKLFRADVLAVRNISSEKISCVNHELFLSFVLSVYIIPYSLGFVKGFSKSFLKNPNFFIRSH